LTPLSVPWAVETTNQIEVFNPDVVLLDLVTPGAGIASEAAGVPYVEMQTSVPVHRLLPGLPVPGRGAPPGEDEPVRKEEFIRIANEVMLPQLNAARARFGLPPDTDPWAWEDRADRFLIPSSPAFDFPADSYPPNYVFTGTLRPVESGAEWDNPWNSSDDRPLIVASSTTTGMAGLWFAVFKATANAVVNLGMRGLLTHGPLFDPQPLPQAESLAYRRFVPHSAVLPTASAMVSQCGHGATIAALRYGVPMVCVPVFADQFDVAARVVHHGVGVRLTTLSSEEEFRNAIEEVVRNPSYREAAQQMAEKLGQEDGAKRAADEIEAVARSHSTQ
jgi:MGT family glycosyltransferase